VQSDYSVKALQERRLIEEVGRKHAPGRPVLYGTTEQFLHQFNLHDLSQLPPLEFDDSNMLAIVGSTPTSDDKDNAI
jgi:segregation and condensation protein B